MCPKEVSLILRDGGSTSILTNIKEICESSFIQNMILKIRHKDTTIIPYKFAHSIILTNFNKCIIKKKIGPPSHKYCISCK